MKVELDTRRSGAMRTARALGLDALREPNLRRLIGAQWTSLIGDYMVLAALPFAVFAIGGSATQVGIAFGVDAMALLLLVLFGGVVGDRVSRRSVMIAADLARFGGEAIFALLLISGHAEFWMLLAVQAVHGAGSAFFLPAMSGLLPETVCEERLQEANALRGLCASSAAMIGPAIAGIALATTGTGISTNIISVGSLDQIHLKSNIDGHKVEIATKGTSDLYVVDNVIAPGGNTGWHSHPGPSLVTVKAGTITQYEGDDPSCTPEVFTAGQSFVDPGGDHVHILRNEGTVPAEQPGPSAT